MHLFSNEWRIIIEKTQFPILNPKHVLEAAAKIKQVWNEPTQPRKPRYALVPPAAMNKENFKPVPGKRIGFDIPLLIESDEGRSRLIAIVAQDPLRQPATARRPATAPVGVSLGTPFAFDCKWYREKTHYGKMWGWIQTILATGCDVYLTDARKLYCEDGSNPIDPEIQAEVLDAEIQQAKPDCIATFGRQAESTLKSMGHECHYLVHPANFLSTADRDQIGAELIDLAKG